MKFVPLLWVGLSMMACSAEPEESISVDVQLLASENGSEPASDCSCGSRCAASPYDAAALEAIHHVGPSTPKWFQFQTGPIPYAIYTLRTMSGTVDTTCELFVGCERLRTLLGQDLTNEDGSRNPDCGLQFENKGKHTDKTHYVRVSAAPGTDGGAFRFSLVSFIPRVIPEEPVAPKPRPILLPKTRSVLDPD